MFCPNVQLSLLWNYMDLSCNKMGAVGLKCPESTIEYNKKLYTIYRKIKYIY